MEMTMEQIKEMKEQIRKEQEELNERRIRVREMEKELFRKENPDKVIIPEITPETLEEAAYVTVREVHLVVDFKPRFINALRRYEKIKTLKELYEWISTDKPYHVRNLGDITIQEAKILLYDIPDIIEKVKSRRKNITKHNTAIDNLIDDVDMVFDLTSQEKSVRTLTQLYNEYVNDGIFCDYYYTTERERKTELLIVELLRRY